MKCQVIVNKEISPGYYKLVLVGGGIAAKAKPGQFVMLQINESCDPLLRRPFALHRWWEAGEIEIIYQVVGKGTSLMSQLCAGEKVDVLGPLGRGFWLPVPFTAPILLAAGSIGMAPLFAFVEDLVSKNIFRPNQIILLIGGKTRHDILALSDFIELGVKIKIATEDGSLGEKGLVTDIMENYLKTSASPVFACGPHGMLQAVASLCQQYKAPCQVSMEALMACGVGACQGCVIKTKDEKEDFTYKRVCREGPVFDAKDIIWET